jgi:hypothetical protein
LTGAGSAAAGFSVSDAGSSVKVYVIEAHDPEGMRSCDRTQ